LHSSLQAACPETFGYTPVCTGIFSILMGILIPRVSFHAPLFNHPNKNYKTVHCVNFSTVITHSVSGASWLSANRKLCLVPSFDVLFKPLQYFVLTICFTLESEKLPHRRGDPEIPITMQNRPILMIQDSQVWPQARPPGFDSISWV
jgi:hypothetical protein